MANWASRFRNGAIAHAIPLQLGIRVAVICETRSGETPMMSRGSTKTSIRNGSSVTNV